MHDSFHQIMHLQWWPDRNKRFFFYPTGFLQLTAGEGLFYLEKRPPALKITLCFAGDFTIIRITDTMNTQTIIII